MNIYDFHSLKKPQNKSKPTDLFKEEEWKVFCPALPTQVGMAHAYGV